MAGEYFNSPETGNDQESFFSLIQSSPLRNFYDVADPAGSLHPLDIPPEYVSGLVENASEDFSGCDTETVGSQNSRFGAPKLIDSQPKLMVQTPYEYADYGKADGCY